MGCKHYWRLGATTPKGTPGKCKLCGKERVFKAEAPWVVDPRLADSEDSSLKRVPFKPQRQPRRQFGRRGLR